MARLPYIEKADLAPAHQDLLKREITLYKQLVNSPNALRAFQGLGQFIRYKSTLDTRLRELAILQVGWLARSPYEWSHHIKLGYEFGVSDADIEALIADTAGEATSLGDLERLVLLAAREATSDGAVSGATFDALRRHLSNEHMIDLVMTVAFYNAVVRVLASLEIDVEPDYQKYLDKYPFPATPV
ncbi:MAG: carboxymuconolactone decarboxylase family protein [Hyphomicrobiaceae bacterium]